MPRPTLTAIAVGGDGAYCSAGARRTAPAAPVVVTVKLENSPSTWVCHLTGAPGDCDRTSTPVPHCPACVSMPGFITALINWPTGLEDERTLVETSLF
jgi:hypothetical protein